ncbi:MAG: hypothetical protein RBG13Loki_3259 [Promethearchaeota archaeon CR_4]|nr:MAG: hypothetical protein RBG13Loki_3259 [Candidatus Lokiarchaeota archaeon CR_4]
MLPDVIESFTPDGIVVQVAGGGRIEINYRDLIRVTIDTTDEGPWLPDCFWYLTTKNHSVSIENNDPFIQVLLAKLQKLPGFKSELVVKAMASTEINSFIVWEQ